MKKKLALEFQILSFMVTHKNRYFKMSSVILKFFCLNVLRAQDYIVFLKRLVSELTND